MGRDGLSVEVLSIDHFERNLQALTDGARLAPEFGGVLDGQNRLRAKSWKFSASTKGEPPYVCTFHLTMKAMLNVK
jgi:hypothetical protein